MRRYGVAGRVRAAEGTHARRADRSRHVCAEFIDTTLTSRADARDRLLQLTPATIHGPRRRARA